MSFLKHISAYLFKSISPRSQPLMTRQSYRHELTHAMTYPVAMAMLEGAVVSMLAKITFNVSSMAFAAIVAAPMFANLTSFFWAKVSNGRRKIPFLVALQLGVLAIIASISILPTTGFGPLLLPWLVIVGRCMQAGIVTIRSAVWRMNYPRHVRAQISGHLVRITMLFMIVPPLIGFALQDTNPNAFRIFYPASLILGLIGTSAYARIRLRHENGLLLHEKKIKETFLPQQVSNPTTSDGIEATDSDGDSDAGGSDLETAEQSATVWTVLRTDHMFRNYMICQFIAGMSTMMGETVIYAFIAEALMDSNSKNLLSIVLAHSLPLLLAVLTLSMWARFLDRVHIARFRSRQSMLWIVNQGLNWLGTTMLAWPVIWIARLSQGITRGGGMLAWQLGHNDFSHRHHASLYMGIHVTLTGVRGAIAPFIGIALYKGWNNGKLLGLVNIPAFEGIGYSVFGITTGLAVISWIGFTWLDRVIHKEKRAE